MKSSKPTSKPKKERKRRFKKRQVEVITKHPSSSSSIKNAFDKLDHSYQADVQRESLWSKITNFFRVKPLSEQKTHSDKFFYKLKNWWPLSKISGRIFLIYLATVLLGTVLLAIPGIVIKSGGLYDFDFLTSAFTTSSAFSDTGINIADVSHDYSFWGQLIIVILIELGGIGIMALKIVFYLAINRKISINDTTLAQVERGSDNLNSAIVLIRDGFLFLTIIQLISAATLFFLFYFTEPGMVSDNMSWNGTALVNEELGTVSPYQNFAKSLWFAIFHSTSALNNAGFDLASSNSLQPYNVDGHHSYAIQLIFLTEWVLGGLGYPTFHDIKQKIKARRTGETVRFSLFTKLNFIVYFTLFVLGPLSVFGTEMVDRSNSLVFNYYTVEENGNIAVGLPKAPWIVAMDIIFNSSSTRNAGFSSVNINDFNGGSKAIMGVLMFIGSAPSSTAGGIRTTTFAVLILATLSIIRNRDHVIAFKRKIPNRIVKRAFAVFFLSALILTIAIIIAFADSSGAIGSGHTGDSAIIEAFLLYTSAFGTVGLNPFSPEQTYALGALTKITLILIMFLGQLGISNTLLVFVKSGAKRHYDYLEEELVIG